MSNATAQSPLVLRKELRKGITTSELIEHNNKYNVGDVVRVTGFWGRGDGPCEWKKSALLVSASQSPSQLTGGMFSDGGGNRWDLINDGEITPSKLGAIGGGVDDTKAIQATVNYALAQGTRDIVVNNDYIVNLKLQGAANVTFVGSGSIKGDGAYRVRVTPYNSQGKPGVFCNLDSINHLSVLSASKDKKVSLVGDSISTEIVNSQGWSETFWFRLQKKMTSDIAENITFYNRSVGGNTWSDANDKANPELNAPDWYADREMSWLSYVEADEPDLIFLAFGMNDKQNFDQHAMRQVVFKIKSWAKVPDIVFVTNMVPSIETIIGDYHTRTEQEGRDYVAGYVRTYALRYGHGLIDINRMNNMVRDGFDVRNSAQVRLDKDLPLPSGIMLSTKPCRDFWMSNVLSGDDSEILAYYQNAEPISFLIGAHVSDLLFVRAVGEVGDAVYRYTLFSGFGAGNQYLDVTTSIAIPTGGHQLIVSKQDNQLTIAMFVNATGSFEEIAVIPNIITHGGEFYPRAGYFGIPSGPFTLGNFSYGIHKQNKPTLTNDEIWGDHTATTAQTQQPYGGNGINHPTTLGVREVYGPLLDICNFSFVSLNGQTYKNKENKYITASTLTEYDGLQGAFFGADCPAPCYLIAQEEIVMSVSIAQVKPHLNDDAVSLGAIDARWSDTFSRNFRPGDGAVIWTSGNGTPEGVITAPVGSAYTRADGGAGTTLYVKESGAGNSGWVAK